MLESLIAAARSYSVRKHLIMAPNLRPPSVCTIFVCHRQVYPEGLVALTLAKGNELVSKHVSRRLRTGTRTHMRQVFVPCAPGGYFVCEAKQFVHGGFLTFQRSLSLGGIWSKLSRQFALVHRCARAALLGAAFVTSASTALAADGGGTSAAGSPLNVFAAALVEGYAATPAPLRSPAAAHVLESLQAQTGSTEPISLVAQRIARFTQQSRCGRVRFALAQPASKKVWPAFGGQMNVCEDGQPPLRTCPEHAGVLVPAAATCSSGKPPVDTEEVAAAIRRATSNGAITHDEMLHDWFQKINAHAHSALTSSPAPSGSGARAGAVK